MTINALYEDIVREAEENGKIEKYTIKTGDAKKIQKKFVDDYVDNILKDVKIDVIDSDLKSKLKETK